MILRMEDYKKPDSVVLMLKDWNYAIEVMMQAMDEEDYEYVTSLLSKMNEQYLNKFGRNVK